VDTAPIIAQRLIAAGCDARTPIAVIENGTRPEEIRVFGELSELPFLIEEEGITGPALLIIGDVAGIPLDNAQLAQYLPPEFAGTSRFEALALED
jgi:uroporphyrin-III C-methyltransferase / precorrin-2 dehydrogenase / sirohydrochlorin ferrochelatase